MLVIPNISNPLPKGLNGLHFGCKSIGATLATTNYANCFHDLSKKIISAISLLLVETLDKDLIVGRNTLPLSFSFQLYNYSEELTK